MLCQQSNIRYFPSLTIVNSKGEKTKVDFEDGQRLFDAVEGTKAEYIRGECGGNMSCGLCFVEVPPNAFKQPDVKEMDLLEETDGTTKYSRLACQLILGPQFEDVEIHVRQ
ncbi:Ferredoxin 6 [Trichomonas vaginalis G3]|uniref:Ferredoxin 6 n=1 Tax=Trichomonas vaginalis (strain ATCC PRA-98 / G3) TaxID=412133 RepID=A2FUY5_TRIV3|nr:2 iron, 2 sulfur cluster binding [Trichomonas vaginalis G3]EAX91276.1 Ferredoxin 6 [Trichomonas vaginalis G3]KAI5538444.1 2 iron, 2 sulfur cluster binding [Trichomonas vaginalis G3]|eukprot:XP_001304206.1 Ferredoxin 6 [Trichomonas vaginalis G3]